jgi:hypothetical protein
MNLLEYNSGRFTMFSVITKLYSTNTKRPTLMELFTATEKQKQFFFCQCEMFDVCTTGDATHIDAVFLPHTRQHWCIDIFHCCNDL